jgi:hypothetical protein
MLFPVGEYLNIHCVYPLSKRLINRPYFCQSSLCDLLDLFPHCYSNWTVLDEENYSLDPCANQWTALMWRNVPLCSDSRLLSVHFLMVASWSRPWAFLHEYDCHLL